LYVQAVESRHINIPNDFGKYLRVAMGGSGSTRWYWYTKKQTVENSIKLSVDDLLRRVIPKEAIANQVPWHGSILFRRDGIVTYSILYTLDWPDTDIAFLSLDYPMHQRRMVAEVNLETTECHLGGARYWFNCPECDRRVGCLYLPHRKDRFLCRKCHKLTYDSAQRAHEGEGGGYLGIIGRNINELQRTKKLQKKLIGRHYGSKAWVRITNKIDAILANIARRNGVMQQAREKHKEGVEALIKHIGISHLAAFSISDGLASLVKQCKTMDGGVEWELSGISGGRYTRVGTMFALYCGDNARKPHKKPLGFRFGVSTYFLS
jgi:hypothetical protein